MSSQASPTGKRKDEDCELTSRQILLKAEILVRCHEDFESSLLRGQK